MRNLKRALSLGLTAAMISGLMVMGSSAASYADVTSEDNQEAIEVLQAVEIMVGDENGDFNPDQNVTRNEMAVIMSNLMEYNVASYKNTSPFTDVPAWAEPYVAACWTNGITAGYSDTIYGGSDTVTTAQAALMLMKALGYFQYASDFGSDWQLATTRQGNAIDLFKGVDSGVEQAMTRNDVAQLVLNTLQSGTVQAESDGAITVGDITIASGVKYNYITSNQTYAWAIDDATNTNNDGNLVTGRIVELGEKLYMGDLKLNDNTSDEFMRPSRTWSYEGKEIGTYAKRELQIASYTTGVTGKEMYNLLSSSTINECDLFNYVDGVEGSIVEADLSRSNNDNLSDTDNGVLTEVYLDLDRDEITIVSINTWLAQATGSYSDSKEYAPLKVFTGLNGANSTYNVDVEDVPEVVDVADEEFYLVNISYKDASRGEVVAVKAAEVMEDSTVSKWSKSDDKVVDKLTTGGTEYKAAAKAFYDDENLYAYDESLLTDMTYNVYLDQYGYAIGVDLYEGTLKYVFITGYDRPTSNLSVSTAKAAAIFLDGTMEEIDVNVKDTNSNIDKAKDAYYTRWTNVNDGEYDLNRWYTYSTNENGVYTLKPVTMTATYYGADKELNTSNVNVQANLAGDTTRVYGEDDSTFITVDTDMVDTTNGRKLAITDVTGVYTGVQNVDLEIDVDTFPYGVEGHIYTVYDKDHYIIGAVALADATGSTANYAYILSGAKSEEKIGDTYYWTFEAVLNGEIQTLTAKSKYTSIINALQTGEVQELRFDADNYVVKVMEPEAYYDYADAKTPAVDITKSNVYFVNSKDSDYQLTNGTKNLVLNLQGRTLYITPDQKDMGLAIVKDAKAVVIQPENGKNNVKTEFDSVSAAISYLADPVRNTTALEYVGEIAAVLNSNGTAAWVVFDSETELVTGADRPTDPTYSTDAEFISLSGTTLTYYLENPSSPDLAPTDVEDIFAMLADAGYTNISYKANEGWTFTTPGGLTMTTEIQTLQRMVKISVDGKSKMVAKGTDVQTATGNSYAKSATTFIATGDGYVANNKPVTEGTKYYTAKEYVKFTGTALAGTAADKFTVTYATKSGTVLNANDYVAADEIVVTTITAKEVISNGAGISTAFKLTVTGGTAVYTGELSAKDDFTGNGTATVTAKSTDENAAVVIRGDIFTITADADVTANTPYSSVNISVALPTA